jgi:hypothetical protein
MGNMNKIEIKLMKMKYPKYFKSLCLKNLWNDLKRFENEIVWKHGK